MEYGGAVSEKRGQQGDRQAPNNETTVTIAAKALAERLGIAEDAAVSVKKRTEAGYVAEVQAGSKTFSGREIRERLGLRSADFTIAKNGDSYIFTVHGYGHGAGMSQYGASFLAEQEKIIMKFCGIIIQGSPFRFSNKKSSYGNNSIGGVNMNQKKEEPHEACRLWRFAAAFACWRWAQG